VEVAVPGSVSRQFEDDTENTQLVVGQTPSHIVEAYLVSVLCEHDYERAQKGWPKAGLLHTEDHGLYEWQIAVATTEKGRAVGYQSRRCRR
jgi:hypothetical protein